MQTSIKLQLNNLLQTVRNPLMILNMMKEPQDQLLHQTTPH